MKQTPNAAYAPILLAVKLVVNNCAMNARVAPAKTQISLFKLVGPLLATPDTGHATTISKCGNEIG